MLQYKKAPTSEAVVAHLVNILTLQLNAGKRVLWLIPGGSAIEVAVQVGRQLTGLSLENLYVTLTDERYGPVGHKDSNWQQLTDKGLNLPGAHLLPVLSGADINQTTSAFADTLSTQLAAADYSLGLFGMGSDGHTAGILPGTVAVASTELAEHYQAASYLRVTMTGAAIGQLDEAMLYAAGSEKQPALTMLDEPTDPAAQPAQFLKQVPRLTVYTDVNI